MSDAFRTAYIYIGRDFAGTLQETDQGFSFRYDPGYLARPDSLNVSLTLPKRLEAYFSGTMFPFFDGLIPEGWLLNIITENWKIDPKDRFGLLLCACRDPIGNVRILETLQ